MTVSMRIPVLVGGLALAAALFLVPDEAPARDECGTVSNGVVTCADASAPYVFGIRYDVGDGNNDGIAGDIAVTFVGGSVTAVPSAPVTGWGSAIVIRTAQQTDTTSRIISLMAGVGANAGNAVAITQSSGSFTGTFDNTGIVIQQRGARADATTVTLGSGVTIGTMTAPMKQYGVHVLAENGANTGTHTITSAATIYSDDFGLLMDNRGAGDSTVTNSGSITTSGMRGTAGRKSGISVLDGSRNPLGTQPATPPSQGGDSRTAATTTTVTNSGSVTVSAPAARGIDVNADGLGLYKTVNSGTISASGATGSGIYVDARHHRGAAGSKAIEVENSGRITTTGANAQGIHVETVGGTYAEMLGGTPLTVIGNGNIEIENTGSISSANSGIFVNANMGAIAVTHSADTVSSSAADGIRIQQAGADATVESSADVTAKNYGIFVSNLEKVAVSASGTTTTSAGAVSVTHSAGDVAAETQAGIHAENAAGNADAVTVTVSGGTVKSEGRSTPAIAVLQKGTGNAVASVSSGATLTSKHHAGVHAGLRLEGDANEDGQIKITQGGTIAGRTGVYTHVERESAVTIAAGTTTYETRAAAEQPLIDVTWTGSFSHGTTATVAQTDMGRLLVDDAANVIGLVREADAEAATRYGQAAGIEAQVMSWKDLASVVAGGDDPGMVADATEQMNLLSEMHADSRRADILAWVEGVLGNDQIAVTDEVIAEVEAVMPDGGAADGVLSKEEIIAYLGEDDDDRRTLLRNVLAQSFSEEELAVLEAVVTNTGLTDAVLDAALPDDATDEEKMAYRTAVRALLDRHNVGDIRVAVNGGSIATSRGDGVRAYYTTPNAMNGRIDVAIAAGATVDGGMAGVYAANAGMGEVTASSDWGRALRLAAGTTVTLRQQFVTVHGTVMGGTDAAVHLAGGGALLVGERGKLMAGSSGRAILVNDPGRSVIVIDGEVRGGKAAASDDEQAVAAIETDGGGSITLGRTGRVVLPEGAPDAIRAKGASGSTSVILVADGPVYRESTGRAVDRLGGAIVGAAVGEVRFAPTDADGTTGMVTDPVPLKDGVPDTSVFDPEPDMPMMKPDPARNMYCEMASDHRCRLYEALPSVLLAMNGLPSRDERMSAARDARGAWARVEASGGKWQAEDSTETDVAYDHGRYGLRAGVDAAVGEDVRLGLSAHGLRGEAKMTRSGGKVELSGMGLGVSAATMAGEVYIDASAQATWFDVEMTSGLGRMLKEGDGSSYAVGVEAGRRMPMTGDIWVTPRAGLTWSTVSLDDFTDSRGASVSVDDADSLTARLGVSAEAAMAGGGGRACSARWT